MISAETLRPQLNGFEVVLPNAQKKYSGIIKKKQGKAADKRDAN